MIKTYEHRTERIGNYDDSGDEYVCGICKNCTAAKYVLPTNCICSVKIK